MDCMSDIELCKSVEMVTDEEEIGDMYCAVKRIAYSTVVRTLRSGGREKLYV